MTFNVLGIGEVLWDLLPNGRQLGGAPANFACHAKSLGAASSVLTRIGQDKLGNAILERFASMGLSTDLLQIDPENPTGTVTVDLSAEGVPNYIIHENVAWDSLIASPQALAVAAKADAICFGSLAQRNRISRTAIQQVVAAAPDHAVKIFDVNLRQHFYTREIIEHSLNESSVFKLNDTELPIIAEMFGKNGSVEEQLKGLAQMFKLRLVVLTRGAQGSLLYQEGRWSPQRPIPVKIVDTVGAGDSFTAAIALGYLSGMDLDEFHQLAAQVAAYVCSQPGATPALPESLRRKFTISNPSVRPKSQTV